MLCKDSIHGIIDIALIQSCQEENEIKPFVKDYGMIIVDECHHVSSVSFKLVLKQVRVHYVYGLTATPICKDGHQPIIFMQCGKIRYTADAKTQMNRQNFIRTLVPRFTSFINISSDIKTYTQTLEALSTDGVRNNLIVGDVRKTIDEGRTSNHPNKTHFPCKNIGRYAATSCEPCHQSCWSRFNKRKKNCNGAIGADSNI